MVEALLEKKGRSAAGVAVIDFAAYKEEQYELLAAAVRARLDMKKIYEIAGLAEGGR